MQHVNLLMDKYNSFRYARIDSIQNTADNSNLLTILIEDDDGEVTNTIKIEFINITGSRILKNSALGFLDMTSGVTIIQEHGIYGFALGQGSAMLHVLNAPLYILCSEIKIEEI